MAGVSHELSSHLSTAHGVELGEGEEVFHCHVPHCAFKTMSKLDLSNHVESNRHAFFHGNYCNDCDKEFKSKWDYRTHMVRIHQKDIEGNMTLF